MESNNNPDLQFANARFFSDFFDNAEIKAREHIEERYRAEPALHEYSKERAQRLGEMMEYVFDGHFPPDVGPERFEDTFTQLIFTFTNPQDHSDAVSDETLIKLAHGEQMRLRGIGEGSNVVMLLNALSIQTALMIHAQNILLESGQFEGKTFSERLPISLEYNRKQLQMLEGK